MIGVVLLVVAIGWVAPGLRMAPARSEVTPSLDGTAAAKRTEGTASKVHSRMQGVQLIEQREADTAWEVSARDAALYDASDVAVAAGVQAQLYEDRALLLRLEANHGRVDRGSGDMQVRGDVRVDHQKGYTITTEALDWRAESRTLHTEESVRIEGPTSEVTGSGLYSDTEQKRFRLERDVRAIFRLR